MNHLQMDHSSMAGIDPSQTAGMGISGMDHGSTSGMHETETGPEQMQDVEPTAFGDSATADRSAPAPDGEHGRARRAYGSAPRAHRGPRGHISASSEAQEAVGTHAVGAEVGPVA